VTEPLVKPAHLASPAAEPWLVRRKLALVALVLGVLSFLVVAIVQGELSSTPDWRVSLPGFVATAVASLASLARREPGGYWLWAIGLGLAAASLVLGWFLMIAIIIAATAIVILILHAVM
jgi:hypothetical protein